MVKYVARAQCGHDGCKEFAFFDAYTRKEQREIEQRYAHGNWRCMRHTRQDETLSLGQLTRTTEIVSRQEPHGRYFGHSGFVSGPGFKLWAKDFPAGTKLRVTAEIILPDEEQAKEPALHSD